LVEIIFLIYGEEVHIERVRPLYYENLSTVNKGLIIIGIEPLILVMLDRDATHKAIRSYHIYYVIRELFDAIRNSIVFFLMLLIESLFLANYNIYYLKNDFVVWLQIFSFGVDMATDIRKHEFELRIS
jgi:hypothetical protein